MKIFNRGLFALMLGGTMLITQPASAHVCDSGDVRMEHLKDNFYVIYGGGGNIGVLAGEDGVFLIDDQTAPLTPEILALIREINDGPIQFVLNTHLHGDHTGGNENLGREGAVILAHDNVRTRLIEKEVSAGTLPVITFNDQVSVNINGIEARAFHVENAHTDGDSIIYFKGANVVHVGDTMFNTCFPFIDTNSGGSLEGLIPAIESVLARIDEETIVIPGHGPVTDKAGLQTYLKMLVTIGGRIRVLKAEGKTLEEVLAANPIAEFDKIWSWSFISGEGFVTTLYNTMED
jgi:glyoxylase-like metal-dependent hydrolase (beta-lactamase superfamily II)